MINNIIGIITEVMPKDDNGNIIDKQLHSDLITAIQLAKNLHQPDFSTQFEIIADRLLSELGSELSRISKDELINIISNCH